MANPQFEVRAETGATFETVEVKQRAQYYDLDESLAEWELARMTSKTWSMEQE